MGIFWFSVFVWAMAAMWGVFCVFRVFCEVFVDFFVVSCFSVFVFVFWAFCCWLLQLGTNLGLFLSNFFHSPKPKSFGFVGRHGGHPGIQAQLIFGSPGDFSSGELCQSADFYVDFYVLS